MHVSEIYARFSVMADELFRRAMNLASRHRVLRVHHLIATCEDGTAYMTIAETPETPGPIPVRWANWAQDLCREEPAGCLDSPMSNSPTMRRVLSLAADRAPRPALIEPAHLLAMAACCWQEEQPRGPGLDDAQCRSEVQRLCRALRVEPLAMFQPAGPEPKNQKGPGARGSVLADAPSLRELENLVGPPVTSDDLIDLYLAMSRATDPAEKRRLAERLRYLRDRG